MFMANSAVFISKRADSGVRPCSSVHILLPAAIFSTIIGTIVYAFVSGITQENTLAIPHPR
jgi:hypothetical protein